MTLLGAGLAPAGSSLAGLGLLVETAEVKPRIFTKADGTQGNVPLIEAGDYVLDSRGRLVSVQAEPAAIGLIEHLARGLGVAPRRR